ncbi:hypothetical protein GCK32_018233 [Trichostrongylus colubriformis]|uniref:Uncharacterized protein n=1 Tax=Trichostrongylus colubriformis TaxID=6319 RepID=A0AAN8IDL5_TRICO
MPEQLTTTLNCWIGSGITIFKKAKEW